MTQDSIRKLIDIIDETEIKVKEETNKNTKYYYKNIIKGIEDVLIYEGYCPICSEELKFIKSQEYMGDCMGVPAYEDVERYVCENGHKFE